MEELIKVTGLTKSYENSPAVSDLSFSVKKGEIVGLLGPNVPRYILKVWSTT